MDQKKKKNWHQIYCSELSLYFKLDRKIASCPFIEKKNWKQGFSIWQWKNEICNQFWSQKALASKICTIIAVWAFLCHCCILMRPRQAVRPQLINLKMKHCPGCAIDVSYMRWQIQAIPCVPSVIISFSPGGSYQNIHWQPAMWNAGGRERERELAPPRLIAHMGED